MYKQLDRLLGQLDDCTLDDGLVFPVEYQDKLESLLSYVSAIEPEQCRQIYEENPGLQDRQPLLPALYARYVRMNEVQEVEKRLADNNGGIEGTHFSGMSDFAESSYRRVRDMFTRVDFSACRRFVMVGCGPLPVTILHVMDETGVPEIIAIDIDETALKLNEAAFPSSDGRLQMIHADGSQYDYSAVDIVYIANLISPKSAVLSQVADSASAGTRVILRDPFSMGRLFAESGIDSLDSRYEILGDGDGDPRFMSRHVFLQLTDAEACR